MRLINLLLISFYLFLSKKHFEKKIIAILPNTLNILKLIVREMQPLQNAKLSLNI
jgi:predicted PurR-regulated permease PerM